MIKKNIFSSIFFLLFNVLSPAIAEAKIKIVSSIPDFAAIASEVGRHHVETKSLVRPTQDPHFLDAKPSFIVDLNRANLVLLTGMELEAGWLPPLLVGARNAQIQKGATGHLDCSTLIAPLEAQGADRAKGDIHPGGNPHYWTDPRNGIRLARGIAKRLAQIDAAHAQDYQKFADDFVRRLEEKIVSWRKMLAPRKGTKVVVYHRSWTYFLNFAEYTEVAALEPKPGIPPSPNHVANLIQQVKDQHVRYVIQESFYPTQLSQTLAQKSGAQLKVLPTMVGSTSGATYIDVVDFLVRELTK